MRVPAADGGRGAPLSDCQHQLLVRSGRAIGDYRLVEPGARILVGVSGGCVSLALLQALLLHQRRFHAGFELVAVHLRTPGQEPAVPLLWLEQHLGVTVHSWNRPPPRPSRGGRRERASTRACRLLLGQLRRCARQLGCNVVAVGAVSEDFLLHLLDNLFFRGRLAGLPVRQPGHDGVTVIRPLVEVPRALTRELARELGLTELARADEQAPPADEREAQLRGLLERLRRHNPRLERTMLAALKHPVISHLFPGAAGDDGTGRP